MDHEQRKQKCRDWYASNRVQVAERDRRARANESADERARRLKTMSDWTRNLRAEVLLVYGHQCKCCGETAAEFLAIDHIKGDGNKHRREIGVGRGGCAFYAWLKKQGFPKDDFRLLCHNCNVARGLYSTCPHEHARCQPARLQNRN